MTEQQAMRVAVILFAVLLTGCTEYKCVDGTIYSKLDKDTWVKHGLWSETKCITGVAK